MSSWSQCARFWSSRRISLVEDEVDHFQDGGDPRGELTPPRDFEWRTRLCQRPLRPDDPLRDGRLRDEKRPRNLVCRQSPKEAQSEGRAHFGGKYRMAGDEDQPEKIVPDMVVRTLFDLAHGLLLFLFDVPADLAMLPIQHCVAAKEVDGAMLRGSHQPGPRIVGDPGLRPPLERGDEGVLREVLGDADVPHDARQRGNELRGFNTPYGVDRSVDVGSHDGYRSHHQ